MDGLVLDSESTYLRAWQQAGQEMGYAFSDAFCLSMSGLHSKAVTQALLTHCGADFDLHLFQQLSGDFWYTDVQLNGIEKMKGLDDLLAVIKKNEIPFCLATNSLEKNARECLALAGLKNEFKLIIARDHVEQGKPAPDIFLKAADLLQQPIAKCMVLEDSATGIEAAKNAGAIKVLIPSQPPVNNALSHCCDVVLNDLNEVAEIILANLPKNKNLAV
ncbi:MAG: HAD-IA family hydrolase [Methylococcaceae bacterium]|nr:HAD-IA family hydrolase [Methylococcaceae bacterium]